MSRVASLVVACCLLGWASTALALEDYVNLIPNQVRSGDKPCITCHNNPNGGAGCGAGTMFPDDPLGRCWNPFGRDFSLNARVWNEALANQDSDGDGFTNGQELQDPTGAWRYLIRPAHPGTAACVSSPGVSIEGLASDPGGDVDRDGYCCIGRDNNADGDCRDSGEHVDSTAALTDCDDADAQTHPEQRQHCVDTTLDNDCDGAPGMLDSDCADLVDNDGDGYCEVGQLQGTSDRYCLLPAEQMLPGDCDDARASVFPGNVEACFDDLDNDCDGALDLSDDACMGESARGDADGDGYCPVGRDLNHDGDCGDVGEDSGASDCNDGNAAVHPLATEECLDHVDNNCDGKLDLEDERCATLVDGDGDGFCPVGADTSVPPDGDCADDGESLLLSDCDDADPASHPGAHENCLDDADNDCDGAASLVDDDCADFLDHDGDGYCRAGWDLDANGSCVSGSEPNGPRDCNDDDAAVNPRALEVCTDAIDNDCDGRRDGSDSDCSMRVDTDRDSFCEAGRDRNHDGDCTDDAEDSGPFDCDPQDGTVFPGAPEHCFDDRDNDCNGVRDAADPQCTSAYDADGDGYCPLGRDLNGDGDCNDRELGENVKLSDCHDGHPDIHPGAVEDCFDWRDNNCDTRIDIADPECGIHLDHDGDSFCGRGKDLNGDGDCLDGGERTSGTDCDDTDSLVFPGSAEQCDDEVDNDCDGFVDLLDTECLCTSDARCDDGDPCTTDRCSRDGQGCENVLVDVCSTASDDDAGGTPDASVAGDAGSQLPPLHPRGCDCQVSVRGGDGQFAFAWAVLALWLGLRLAGRGRRREM